GPHERLGRRADGASIPLEMFVQPIEHGGRPARLIAFRDLSHRRRLEEQLRIARRMEYAARLARGVAHDVNNLLTAVFGQASLVRASLPAAHPAAASLDEIERAAQAAATIGKALLAFSRPG